MKWSKGLCVLSLSVALLLCGEVPRAGAIFPLCDTNLLLNAGFEYGHNGAWAEMPWRGVIRWDPPEAYRGSFVAELSGSGATSTYALMQVVDIPADVLSATLSFYLRITTMENPSAPYDTLTVRLNDIESSGFSDTLGTYSNKDATGLLYLKRQFDVTKHKGKRVQILFIGQEDYSVPTKFSLDNVALTYVPKFVPPSCLPGPPWRP